VLFLSRLDAKKNLEGLLQAIPGCVALVPDAHWLIAGAGDPDYAGRMRNLAEQLGIADKVTWCGRLDGADKASAFAIARLFVLPSHSENFGIAAAEALAAGVPVVLGRGVALTGQVEAAGAGEGCGTDPASVGAAMLRYLREPDLRAKAAANARELARREFSLDAMGERLEAMYRGLQIRLPVDAVDA
jgi:glycosyltransferase involved in cell wall biosynthesis